MRTEKEIRERLAVVEADERLSYPVATVVENAGLALVQTVLETERDLLHWILKDKQA